MFINLNNNEGSYISEKYAETLDKLGAIFIDLPKSGYQAAINRRISEWTHELVKEYDVGESKAVMLSVMHFKGEFESPFKTTQSEFFYPISNKQDDVTKYTVNMMSQTSYLNFKRTDVYDIVCLKYKTIKTTTKDVEKTQEYLSNIDNYYTLSLILPKGTTIEALQDIYADMDNISCPTMTSEIVLSFPRTMLTSDIDLRDMFDNADLGEYFVEGNLDKIFTRALVDKVSQKVMVDFKETGTEAAAVTAANISVTSFEEPKKVEFNRPFIFAINGVKSIKLFEGVVMDINVESVTM
eukprot:GHVR01095800.1.p1 GENE.GHVR01095800.1~~GHVR01095800.1.p1  ORF type:complete len:314 (+),score=59.90 GHVR01095800.1:55-942(+)